MESGGYLIQPKGMFRKFLAKMVNVRVLDNTGIPGEYHGILRYFCFPGKKNGSIALISHSVCKA